MILIRGTGCEPAAVASHHFVDDELARAGGIFVRHVAEEAGALVSCRRGTERLLDGVDIVVDGLGHPDHRKFVVVLVEVGSQVSGGGVGVVPTDGVKDVDFIGDESVGGDLEGVFARLHETAAGAVLNVGELHAAVANRASTELIENGGALAHFVGEVV